MIRKGVILICSMIPLLTVPILWTQTVVIQRDSTYINANCLLAWESVCDFEFYATKINKDIYKMTTWSTSPREKVTYRPFTSYRAEFYEQPKLTNSLLQALHRSSNYGNFICGEQYLATPGESERHEKSYFIRTEVNSSVLLLDLRSRGMMVFKQFQKGCIISEYVELLIPLIISGPSQSALKAQRAMIMENLRREWNPGKQESTLNKYDVTSNMSDNPQ